MPVARKTDATSLRSVPKAASLTDPEPDASVEARRAAANDGRSTDVESTPSVAAMAQLTTWMAPMRPSGALGTREEIQTELDGIALAVRAFPLKQADQILRETSAYSARLTEMAILLHRSEEHSREYTRIRTMQVQKWLEELERQWKTASRLIEVSRQDLVLLQ